MIGTHEFAYTNRMLLQPDGSTYPTTNKSTVIHMLENLVKTGGNAIPELLCEDEPSCLVVDGMAVLLSRTPRIAKTLVSHTSSSLTQKLEAMIK